MPESLLDGAAPPPASSPAPSAAAPAAPVVGEKPEGLDDKYWDADAKTVKYADLNTELTSLRTIKAEYDIRMGDVPKDGNYKIELKGVEVPEGMDLKINENHPMAAPVKGWAAKHGVPQSAVTELVAIQAQAEIAKATEFKTALAGERTKLGEQGQARIDAVKTALGGRLGEKAAALVAGMVSAEQVEAFESLLRISIASAPAPGNNNAAKPDYAAMSPMERLHYAHETSRKVA